MTILNLNHRIWGILLFHLKFINESTLNTYNQLHGSISQQIVKSCINNQLLCNVGFVYLRKRVVVLPQA